VTSSIAAYYSSQERWTQCQIATFVLGGSCCQEPGGCNVAAYLQESLQVISKLRGILLRSLSFDEVRAELRSGNPIPVRIGWEGGGGHFVVIRGYRTDTGVQLLNIADPFYADSIQDYDEFRLSYLGQGRWTDTFLVGRLGSIPT
jgi:hypothetical protein